MKMRRLCLVFFRRSGTVRIQGQAMQPDPVVAPERIITLFSTAKKFACLKQAN